MSARYRDPEWLRRKYHDEGMTQREMAEVCDVSSRTIRKYMNAHGIETREIAGENHPLHGKERSEETKKKISETLQGRKFSEETLKRMSDSHLGNTLPEEVKDSISNSLKGITRPKRTREKMSASTEGDANPMWKGGVWKKSWYGSEKWQQAREYIKYRDDVCQRCEHDGSERFLDVHHIVPIRLFETDDRLSPEDAHSEGNLLLLCRPCHRRAEEGDIPITPDFEKIPTEISIDVFRLWVTFRSETLSPNYE